jgi:hypothetical protein
MKGMIDLFSESDTDTLDSGDVFDTGPGKLLETSELFQKLLATLRADAGNLFQDRSLATSRPPIPMRGDGKTVGLIPDLLD